MKTLIQYFLPLLLLIPLSLGAEGLRESRSYQVVKVVDGDTFDATDGTIRFRVRIAGIDAPEKRTPFSELATENLKKRIAGKNVELKPVGRKMDQHNRILAQVLLGGHDIGIEMLETGLASYYRFPGCPEPPKSPGYDLLPYIAAEQKAREKKAYLWSGGKVSLPCEGRRKKVVSGVKS